MLCLLLERHVVSVSIQVGAIVKHVPYVSSVIFVKCVNVQCMCVNVRVSVDSSVCVVALSELSSCVLIASIVSTNRFDVSHYDIIKIGRTCCSYSFLAVVIKQMYILYLCSHWDNCLMRFFGQLWSDSVSKLNMLNYVYSLYVRLRA